MHEEIQGLSRNMEANYGEKNTILHYTYEWEWQNSTCPWLVFENEYLDLLKDFETNIYISWYSIGFEHEK